jgi:Protein of unknown function (DUF2752)
MMSGVTTASFPHEEFSPRGALARLASFGACGGALSVLGAAGIGIPCPWRMLTGTLCPLCGATHLGVRLLHLDAVGALAANPFVFVGLVVLAALGVLWSVEALGGPAVRLPARLSRSTDRWWLAVGVLAVTYAVLRNVW